MKLFKSFKYRKRKFYIGNEHSVMVLQKNGNTLTVVKGNHNATVHWERKITKKELQESGFYVETRY